MGGDPHGRRQAIVLVLPLALTVAFFVLIPVTGSMVSSFFRDVTYLPREFIIFENYGRLWQDPEFRQSLIFTLFFTAVSVPLELVLGLIFALLLNETIPGRGLLRAALLVPWAIPAAVSGRIFELIYSYGDGLANWLLKHLGLADAPVNWLGSGLAAFGALVLADVWKTTPFVAILLLAGLSALPEELLQQAKVDRAGLLQRFFRVTLPLLRPVLVVALLFRTIDALRIFDLVYVLTGGGPGGATSSLSLLGYRYFLAGDFGYGSAISTSLFVLAFSLSLLWLRLGAFGREVL